jgi:sterol desaturase/sphingolipid hydroxylase (fatty acid hydroxylase superfamily)
MEHEAFIRLSVFLSLFAALAAIEWYAPRRARVQGRSGRWLTNWGMTIANTIALRALAVALPLLAVGAAIDAQTQGYGLFNLLALPFWLNIVLTILIFDFAIWLQHLITHKVPLLWRLHQVHHSDRDLDVSSAIRFHPLEIALSMLIKIGLVYLLGPAAVAIIAFEIILNATAMFNHANIAIPQRVDRWLRLIIVTPDMHRVHHSDERAEHDSNYGFSLSIWDRLFGTYIAQPEKGHDGMTVGLRWQDSRTARLDWALLLPFRNR